MPAAISGTRQTIVRLRSQTDFAGWRENARRLCLADAEPRQVVWLVDDNAQSDLFGAAASHSAAPHAAAPAFSVPRAFIELAQTVICHRDPARFGLLYGILRRLRDEPSYLDCATEPDVIAASAMAKSVRRDIHKMHAFVRFRSFEENGETMFAAWFEPDHYIVERATPFFMRRFAGMTWSIFTPVGCAHWDRRALTFSPAATRDKAPAADELEDLWRAYYASIFNPARLKVKAMQAEMPRKYWRNLPEAAMIPALIATAEQRAAEMIDTAPGEPPVRHHRIQQRYWSGQMPAAKVQMETDTIEALRRDAAGCTRCDLYRHATQTVFGKGPSSADVVFVGEQPGDQEDLAGEPFIGPAGRLLDEVMEEAGIDRAAAYVTNAVKHFKFEPRGKRRIHQKPNAGEIQMCKWWLARELAVVKPRLAVALGATAAYSLLGRSVSVMRERGTILQSAEGLDVFVTVHPSFLLRVREEETKARERKLFVEDLKKVARTLAA